MDVAAPDRRARSATRRSCSAPTSTTSATFAPASRPPASAARSCRWSTSGLTKAEIRELSRALGLPTWDKPQLACLSSRFPYGTKITPERLRRVDDFEDGLRELGFRQLRVRFHDTIARLEIDGDDLPRVVAPGVRDRIVALGKQLGFAYVALDLAGFRSGSLNEVLPAETLVQLKRRRVVKLALLAVAARSRSARTRRRPPTPPIKSKKDRERAAKSTQHGAAARRRRQARAS